MSILAFVVDPQSDEERAFSVPVASEATFKTRWQPIIEALGLQWVPMFSTGVDIREQDTTIVLNELRDFRAAYVKKFGVDGVIDRVDLLSKDLPKPFTLRRGLVVYIG